MREPLSDWFSTETMKNDFDWSICYAREIAQHEFYKWLPKKNLKFYLSQKTCEGKPPSSKKKGNNYAGLPIPRNWERNRYHKMMD